MAQWESRTADVRLLKVGTPYSKAEVAAALGVPPPKNSRDWGGLVSFKNAELLFITLEKDPARYSAEHRYDDRFDGSLLYWDSRASHGMKSAHVVRVRQSPLVLGFARVREKAAGRTLPFYFVGRLQFEDWWGEKPVRFTWQLRDYPSGLGGSTALEMLAAWRRPDEHGGEKSEQRKRSRAPSAPSRPEGARTQVTANRYERDPRARQECLDHHGTSCNVCEFNFRDKYGEIGTDFVYVHHRVPVAVRARKGLYLLDPKRDLIPLCGNCHAIVHRRGSAGGTMPGLSAEQARRLKELRDLAAANEWEAVD